jgi:ethanolamine ammonia-lyase small subunit
MPEDRPVAPTPAFDLPSLRRFTPARIALGRAGAAQTTAATLQFALDHAAARDAVSAPLDFEGLAQALIAAGWNVVRLSSAARTRAEYLRRPDLGRRLSPESRAALASQAEACDVALIVADGLSSAAVAANAATTLDTLRARLTERGLRLGPLALAAQGRVAIGDEIGEILGARLSVVLIGERPGLSAADSLGAYITWNPRVGVMDSGRNCVSNIRAAGLALAEAARQIDDIVARAFLRQATGVALGAATPPRLAEPQPPPS